MMKPKYMIAGLLPLCAAFACKKDSPGYYHGTWSLREQTYSSTDTSYTDTMPAGSFTYTFMENGNVHIVHTGLLDMYDTWQAQGEDSLRFGMGQVWAIQEKQPARFKAKYYPTASAFWLFTLEK